MGNSIGSVGEGSGLVVWLGVGEMSLGLGRVGDVDAVEVPRVGDGGGGSGVAPAPGAQPASSNAMTRAAIRRAGFTRQGYSALGAFRNAGASRKDRLGCCGYFGYEGAVWE